MIRVASEIGQLREVLVHRPGEELLSLMPEMLESLLFDDIPYLRQAQKEHDAFTALMRDKGVQVVYLVDLVAEVFAKNDDRLIAFLKTFIREGGVYRSDYQKKLLDYFLSMENPKKIVRETMRGVTLKDLNAKMGETRSLTEMVGSRSPFLLEPIPNLYFTRDILISLGKGALIPRMYSKTRRRETIYTEYLLKYHPRYEGTEIYYDRSDAFAIEGGDLLNIDRDIVAIGISQRTTAEAIEELSESLFYRYPTKISRVLAIQIPNTRAYMHLDTVFTQIDKDAFTFHPDLLSTIRFFVLDKGAEGLRMEEKRLTLAEMLKEATGSPVRLFPCAGGDLIAARREQWNDGSNTLAIAPGEIITYDRNERTNRMLREAGFIVHELPSYELSRGRGGPRCMSMPLCREEI